MEKDHKGCLVCEVTRKPCVCPHCVRKFASNERKQLQALQAKRDNILHELQDRLKVKAAAQKQQQLLKEHHDRLQQAFVTANAVEASLKRVQQAKERLRRDYAERSTLLASSSKQLAAKRSEVLTHYLPDVLRSRQLHHTLVMEKLGKEQRARIKKLLEVLPLSIPAMRNRAHWTQQQEGQLPIPCVAVCGLRLPESFDRSADSPQQAQEWSSALAYVSVLLQLVCSYLGGPLLHTLHYQGSTSQIWLPKSFWDRSCPEAARRLPLFPQTTSSSSSAPLGSSTNHRSPSKLLARNRDREFYMALHLLQRSIGALVSNSLGHAAVKLPSDWSPFAWLAGLCNHLSRDGRPDAVPSGVPLTDGSSMMFIPPDTPTEHSRTQDDFFYGDDEVVDGWDVVQQPFLPPPPSEPDEVEHWTRAHFTDTAANRPRNPRPSFSLPPSPWRQVPLRLPPALPGAQTLQSLRRMYSNEPG